MCGIIYAKNLKDNSPVNNLIKVLYENQKERGQQGFGFVGLNKERIGTYRATDERSIMRYLNERQYDEIVFHHRLPTSTENTLKSTHPFVIEIADRRYYFVHNGIVQNADELKERHAKRGIAYSSEEGDLFNDSEALAWDLCLWLSNRQQKIEAEGSVAFVCLAVSKKTNRAEKLYFYRNSGAQLKLYRDKTLFLLASEGNFAPVKESRLYFWDYQERQVRMSKFLDIRSPVSFTFNQYDYRYYDYTPEDEEQEVEAIIASLGQERDYLLSIGEYARAEEVEEEIDDLKDQLRRRRQGYLNTFYSH